MTAPVSSINFKAERLRRGMSQVEFAEAAKVSVDVIRSLERGAVPQPKHRLALATLVERDVLEIWPLDDTEAAA